MPVLQRLFYSRPTLEVAEDLLGCFLVRKMGDTLIRARIVEVEAYVGEDDLACHASKGRTKRTEIMYGEAGHAYVYLIYGMHDLLNIVTEEQDFPAAILIRAVEIDGMPKNKTNGPGKLTRVLHIDRAFNGVDMTKQGALWVEQGEVAPQEKIEATKRIGIDYAKHCKDYLWRFLLIPVP